MKKPVSRGEAAVVRTAAAAPVRAHGTGLMAALILVAGLLAYSNSVRGVFVLDEQTAIADNPNIRSLATAFSAPPEVGLGGRPIASLSFAINYALAPADGRDAFTPPPPGYPPEASELFYANLWGYHAANLAIHLAAALALFGILRRTLGGWRLRGVFGHAALPLAGVISTWWVLHPLQTNSVTYVAQRVESLAGLFFLLTIYASVRAGETLFVPASPPGANDGEASPAPARRAGLWTCAAVLACLLGAGTKEILVVAPILVVLYDRLFFVQATGRFVRARAPLYAGLFATWLAVLALVLAFPRGASVGVGHEGWSPFRYLLTQAEILVHYLRLAIVPWPLVFDYEWPAAASLVQVLPQGLVLGAGLALTVWGAVRRSPWAFAGAWFFLILAPSSSVLPIVTEVAAEHRMYLPLASVLALVVCASWLLMRRAGLMRSRPAMVLSVAFATTVGMALGWLTYQRNADYHSYERLWADSVAKRPENARARSNYAAALIEAGKFAEAEPHLAAAIRLRPNYPEAHANYGVALCSQGRLDEGIAHLRRAIELEPGYLDAYRNLGEALMHLGRWGEALDAYTRGLIAAPDDPMMLTRAALILAAAPEDSVRNGGRGVRMAEKALQLTGGSDPAIADVLAASLAEAGRFADAVSMGERALALARQRGPEDLVEALHARLEAYRAGQPLRLGSPGS